MNQRTLKRLQRKRQPWKWLIVVLAGALLVGMITYDLSHAKPSEGSPVDFNREQAAAVSSPLEAVRSPSAFVRALCPALGSGAAEQQTIAEILDVVAESTIDFRIDPELVLAVIGAESRCRGDARSPAGALGMMQLMPGTARLLGVEKPESTRENVRAGTEYLGKLISRFEGDLPLALAAYNAGPTTVSRYGGIPPFPETEAFVAKVLAHYRSSRRQAS